MVWAPCSTTARPLLIILAMTGSTYQKHFLAQSNMIRRHFANVAFSGKTHNAQIDILSDLSGNKTIALWLRSLLIVPLNSWGDIWSLRAWMYYLYIHSLIGSIAHTDLIQRNWAVISTQARDYLPLLLLYNAKLPLNLAIKSPRYAFSQRELQIH